MTFHLKTYPDALRQLFVACSIEETNSTFDKALILLQKNFILQGYRKGKVPVEMIAKANPPELMSLVSDLITQEAFSYIEQQKTPLYGQPRFNPLNGLSKDTEFFFSLVYEIYPTITKEPDLSKIECSYEACDMDQKFIENTMCRQIQLLESTSGTIQDFDMVQVEILNKDYTGDKKEASFDTSKLELLIGKKTDETVSISFDDLSGYLLDFIGKVSDPVQVKITDILRAKDWAKVTDAEIAEKSPFKTKKEYLEQSQSQFENLVTQYNNTQKTEALSNTVSSQLQAELPKSLWLNNLRDLAVKVAEKEVIKEDMSLANIAKNKDILEKFSKLPTDSIEGLSFVIWLENVAQKENMSIDDTELEYHFYRYAQARRIPMNDFKKNMTAEEKESIRNEVIREKAVQHLLETVKFTVSKTISLSTALKSMHR